VPGPILASQEVRRELAIPTLLNGLLLLGLIAAAIGLQVANRSAAQVEGVVYRYAHAVSAGDLEAALAEITPEQRATALGFVANQVGKEYGVLAAAVRMSAVLAQLPRLNGEPFEVTVVLDIDPSDPQAHYRATTTVPVERGPDRWYLAAPLLEPEANDPVSSTSGSGG
jgi:hypothetical protein